jgi:hypothetical protein
MAVRLGLLSLEQVVATIVEAVEHPPASMRIVGVPEMRAGGRPPRIADPA